MGGSAVLERDIVAGIRRYLGSLGADCYFFKEHGGQYGSAGIPDLIICYKGRFVGLEAKTPTGRLTKLQRRAAEQIQAAGGVAVKVTSVAEVREIIRKMDVGGI